MASNNDHLKLKGVTRFSNSFLMNEIEVNLREFFNWGFLAAGAWTDVEIPLSGAYGGSWSTLNLVSDPSYPSGQIWETPRMNLCYESGVNYNDSNNPISISGVWVDGIFTPLGSGVSLDYKHGRAIFDPPISTTANVEMNYSFKNVVIEIADESDMWAQIQQGSMLVNDSHLTESDQGEWTGKLSLSRQQLPLVVIECVPRGISKPYSMGSGSLLFRQDVMFYVVAEGKRFNRNNIMSIIGLQNDKTIKVFNSNEAAESGVLPLNMDGTKNEDGFMYPQLVEERNRGGLKWNTLRFEDTTMSEVGTISKDLFVGAVRSTIEIVYANI